MSVLPTILPVTENCYQLSSKNVWSCSQSLIVSAETVHSPGSE
jgi:hypothetical protein